MNIKSLVLRSSFLPVTCVATTPSWYLEQRLSFTLFDVVTLSIESTRVPSDAKASTTLKPQANKQSITALLPPSSLLLFSALQKPHTSSSPYSHGPLSCKWLHVLHFFENAFATNCRHAHSLHTSVFTARAFCSSDAASNFATPSIALAIAS